MNASVIPIRPLPHPWASSDRGAEAVAYAYRAGLRTRARELRDLADTEWGCARICLEAVRYADAEHALTPYLLALHHRQRARTYMRRARGQEL